LATIIDKEFEKKIVFHSNKEIVMAKERLEQYLNYLIKHNGSDLHLKAGSVTRIRINGELYPIERTILTSEDAEALAKTILTPSQYEILATEKEFDHSYALENARFRANLFYQFNGLSIVLRAIPATIPTLRELRTPSSIEEFADKQKGLILVTGATGSGKSTTIASLIERINKLYRRHIITIEDPIEYVFKEDRCIISQRAIGENAHSFERALTAAFREDFDVLFIGEIRNLETMQIALHAANTGHLVLSTLHTQGSVEAIGRIVNMFPTEDHDQVRSTLSQVLIGIVAQRLVKDKNDRRIPAVEILKNTTRIADLISQNRDYDILDAMAKGENTYGMQTLDQALVKLFQQGFIEKEEMLMHATSPSDIKLITEGLIL
jgi:twitching motility protein PilT